MNQQDILDSLWIEKFRPRTLEDMALLPDYRMTFEGFVRDGIIPHLLFEGPPGSGKTTIARVFLDLLDCEALKMNASDERGIDVIRGKVKNFARVSTLSKFKIVFLDEADRLTPEAQDALKNTMEQYSKTTRFILTCNHVNRIDDAIQSRCQAFQFSSYPKFEVKKILLKILENEKMKYEEADVDKLLEKHYPDLRKTINEMQKSIRSGKFEFRNEEETFKLIIDLLNKKNLKELRKLLVNQAVDYVNLYRYIYDNIDMFPDKVKLHVLLNAAEYLWRDSMIVDKEINFVGFCISIVEVL